ncbi:UNVERIFIED_CONTAM: hypothetical protein FKN15_054735 [Acipenser sinensis]
MGFAGALLSVPGPVWAESRRERAVLAFAKRLAMPRTTDKGCGSNNRSHPQRRAACPPGTVSKLPNRAPKRTAC